MIPLPLVKQHLRVEGDEEDILIDAYLAAAADAAEKYLDRTLYPEGVEIPAEDECGLMVNPSVTAAILLMVGHLYENREEVVTGTIATQLPMTSRSLLWPYRIGLGV